MSSKPPLVLQWLGFRVGPSRVVGDPGSSRRFCWVRSRHRRAAGHAPSLPPAPAPRQGQPASRQHRAAAPAGGGPCPGQEASSFVGTVPAALRLTCASVGLCCRPGNATGVTGLRWPGAAPGTSGQDGSELGFPSGDTQSDHQRHYGLPVPETSLRAERPALSAPAMCQALF